MTTSTVETNSKIVIVVARELRNRRVLTNALQREGYVVVELESVGDVMGAMQSGTMAVFVDVSSEMDGGAAMIRRTSSIDREVPVVAVTDQSGADARLNVLRSGAYDCMCGSLDHELLLAVTERAVEHRNLHLRAAMLERRYRSLQTAVKDAMDDPNGADLEQEFGEGTDVRETSMDGEAANSGVVPLRVLEERAIKHAMQVTNGSVTKAARLLGIGRATLYRRLANNADSN